MVTLLTIQILSIVATTITNLLGILTFTTDYWTIIVYDLVKLHSAAQWIVLEDINNGDTQILNTTNETQLLSKIDTRFPQIVLSIEENLIFSKAHKGLFRQCNYLSDHLRKHLDIPRCRALKSTHNQYDDQIHGMINPGREFIRLHNIAASCAILIILLLCACTLIGIVVGILNSAVLATMTVGIIYLVATLFGIFILAIMQTILKSERKRSHCFALEIFTDQICAARTIEISYSFILGYLLVLFCFTTSAIWLSLQEKQRQFAQH